MLSRHLLSTVLVIISSCICTVLRAEDAAAKEKPPAEARNDSKVIRLWAGDAPGALGKEDADVPTLTVYAPEKPNGAAMVVCPGGGYGMLADHEGKPVAEWLNTLGVTGFVLKYRLGPKYHHPVMLQDVSRAIRTVRAGAKEWRLDPKRMGVLGFSAGGHLASTAVTHFDDGQPTAEDAIERMSSRPDFGVLIYPVITLTGPFAHAGSRENLLGKEPSTELVEYLSNQNQVTGSTPPCFLIHSVDDPVFVENSMMFADALRQHKVPFEMHLFEHGGHGYGLGQNKPEVSIWPELCGKWMENRGLFKAAEKKKQKKE